MTKFSLIIVPTDFSDASYRAGQYAATLGEKLGGKLCFLHVVPIDIPAMYATQGEIDSLRNESAQKQLDDFMKKLDLPKSVSREAKVVVGTPAHAICEIAEKGNADVIVMATHGRTGLPRFLIGSVAERVVRHAPCSVLVLRDKEAQAS